MSWLDLHLHSCYSDDGEFQPTELMALCKQNGIRTAAVADHNCVRAIPEAREAAHASGVTLVPGVELDCVCNSVNLHVLGYWIDPLHPGFEAVERDVLEQEQSAAKKRIEMTQALGLQVDAGELLKNAKDGVVTGEMIAEAALAQPENEESPLLAPYRPGGSRADNPFVNFYWDFCSQGKPAYVPIQFISLREAVTLIRDAGGIAVLAHPGINIHEDAALLDAIVAQGVVGLEAFSSYHSPEQTAFYQEQARLRDLAISCGSDFHGKIKPAIRIGGVDCGGSEDALLSGLLKKHEGVQ